MLYFTWNYSDIYIYIYIYILKIPQVAELLDSSPSGMSVHFNPYRKDKIRTVRKKYGRLVTLSPGKEPKVSLDTRPGGHKAALKLSLYIMSHVSRNPPTSMQQVFRIATNFPLLWRHAVMVGSTLNGTPVKLGA
jgi:hypothetical protein